jgi:polyphosphate kinase
MSDRATSRRQDRAAAAEASGAPLLDQDAGGADETDAKIPPPPAAASEQLKSPARFINRELSWIEFNRRVLEEAENRRHPVLERLRFLSISGSNLDEFYTVRVAGLRAMVRNSVTTPSQDGLTPSEQLAEVNRRAGQLLKMQQTRWRALVKEMRASGVMVLRTNDLTKSERAWLREDFLKRVFPLITPLAIDPAHPFPFIPNLGFALVLLLKSPDGLVRNALVPIPSGAGRRPTSAPPRAGR